MADFLSIESERLYLRPFKDEDAEAVNEYQSDPDVVRFIPWPVRDLAGTKEFIAERKGWTSLNEEGDYLVLAVVRKSDNKLIGQVNAMYRSKEHQKAEFGYGLNRSYQGQGYINEATTALITALFETGLFHTVFANIDDRNGPSERVVQRLGLRKEAHHILDYWFKGEWTSSLIYAIRNDEWPVRP
jgi:RimJ/RimL family protein N-acetyltransferase